MSIDDPVPDTKNSLCAQPWVGLQVSANREIRPCCMYDEPLGEYNGKQSIEAYFKGNEIKEVRKTMLAGQWPDGCKSCRKEDRKSVV